MSRSSLSALGLIDTPQEAVFDSFTILASRLLKAPVSLVSIIDEAGDRQFFKSQLGLAEPWATSRQTPLSQSFCRKVVETGKPLVVCNARQDDRVRDNPVIDLLGVVAYLGAPIYGPDDVPIGSFCVIENQPRIWTDEEKDTLQRLATQVSAQIRMRHVLQELETSRAELRREYDDLGGLLETMPAGVLTLDGDGQVLMANQLSRDILGLGPVCVVGWTWAMIAARLETMDGRALPGDTLPGVCTPDAGGAVRDLRYALRLPDDGRRILSVRTTSAGPSARGSVMTCTISDITDQTNAEVAGQSARKKAEAASRAKSIFLANMSHEIRTPLNGIIGMTEVMGNTSLSEEQGKMLSVIRSSGDLLLGVIDDILDLARIEEGKLPLVPASFEPAQLLDRVGALHATAARNKGITLDIALGPGLTFRRIGDAGRIVQIIGNLVANAIKFTEKGSVRVEAREVFDSGLVITVTDTGIGMTNEQLTRVFSEFEQADSSITRRFGGTGLGLPIVRRLVDLMGGHIKLASAIGSGTEVEITLPLPRDTASVPDPVSETVSDPVAGAVSDPVSEPGAADAELPIPPGLRVLVAEDNRVNTLILKMMLEAMRVRAVFVADGQQACQLWKEQVFDLLIFDISMPVLDGVSAFREIEKAARAEGRKMPPAIASTANVMRDQVAHYLATGFAGVLAKPYRKSDLRCRIAEALCAG